MTALGKAASVLRLGASTALAVALFAQAGHAQTAPAQGSAADAQRLSAALRTLAQNPQSGEALIAAGEASLKLDDAAAAQGFFRRAEALNPQDPRVKAGLASVLVRQRNPAAALALFAEAERGGALSLASLADRGLAYDLIGDNARAQRDYFTVLSAGPDVAVSRRLALSQAIAGDSRGSEATLLPLLQRSDLAAYRTRAFALAIAGRGDEAVSIAETMLPDRLSGRMAPYLRYMPRLTRAQQAAAANLGAFPPAGDIGRDDPAIAALAAAGGTAEPVRPADARLVPSGPALGDSAVRRRETPVPPARATPLPVQVAVAQPAPRSATPNVPERARALLEQHPNTPVTPPTPAPRPTPAPSPAAALAMTRSPATPASGPPGSTGLVANTVAPAPVTVAAATPPPLPVAVELPPISASGPALGQVPPPVMVALQDSPPAIAAPAATPPPAPAVPPRPASLTEAFADFDLPSTTPAPAAAPGAVDIASIQPRREQVAVTSAQAVPKAPAPKPAAPKPPPVPSRHWVQVATGRDTAALAFDWRRLKREAGGLLDRQTANTAKWGQTNRLVVGPFATSAAADQFVGKLKDKKLDAFRFTSAAGEEVKPLG